MIGSTNLSGGGGVGSDELTATAANVLEETTYVGADTDDELAEGTMRHLTNRATITHTAENATKVIEGDAAFTSTNSDGTARAEIRYNGTEGFITPNTLFAVPQGDMATAGGLTAGKLLQGQSAFGIAGTATSDATGTAAQLLNGKILYGKGSKITGTMGDYSGKTSTSNYVSSTFRSATSGYVFASPGSTGYYTTGSYLRIPASNLSAANIKKGVSIMGITGTFEGAATSPTYLFNNGNYGGGQSGITMVSSSIHQASYSIGNTISGSNLYKGQILFRFNNIQNLSGWNYLKIYGNLGGTWAEIGGGVNTDPYKTYMTALTNYVEYGGNSSVSGNGTAILNISSLSGNYWIYVLVGHVSGNNARSASISQVYLSTT